MGSSESTLSTSQSQEPVDKITIVSERVEDVDPLFERLKSLKIATPILTSSPVKNSLTDIIMWKSSSSSVPGPVLLPLLLLRRRFLLWSLFLTSCRGTLNPEVLLELFSIYHDCKAKKISQRQGEMENKIEVADALAVKVLQHFNFSVSIMRTTAYHLFEAVAGGGRRVERKADRGNQ
ncbi:PREDICTED: uncharacterized protein LOC104607485 isoform X3 [Nelumbo nucifera]|uniref:Uncharacterized protein LOC104607485 isoform X3 n=1 Tax=Nelumbo nucifera TaxID=4432 RepID=A0A1U8B5G8_NELNU|nr:PREDICTED: uncharacterized protein LOC104607485 isoform X3 [Nelumbo nucifera]